MILRLIIILLLASTISAGELFDNWSPGKGETYDYVITSFNPTETDNKISITINRGKSDPGIFDIYQEIKIPNQNVSFVTMERYQGENLDLKSSLNLILTFRIDENRQMLTDTVRVNATSIGDELAIDCSKPEISPKKIKAENLLTSLGGFFKARNFEYEVGGVRNYNSINFLVLYGSQPLQPFAVVDTVVGIEKVSIKLGEYECYKVKNSVPGVYGYTYYAKNEMNLPVLVELFNPKDDKLIQKIELKNIKTKK